jgi:hypothetical protein
LNVTSIGEPPGDERPLKAVTTSGCVNYVLNGTSVLHKRRPAVKGYNAVTPKGENEYPVRIGTGELLNDNPMLGTPANKEEIEIRSIPLR